MNDKRQQNVKIPWFLLILLAGVIILSLVPFRVLSERLTAGELRMVLASPDEIMEASIELNSYSRSADVVLELSDGRSVKATVPDAEEVMAELDADGVDYTISGIAESSFMDNIPYMIMMVMMFFFFFMLMGARGGAGGMNQRLANFGKSRARLSSDNNIHFSDVAGMEEEKKELREVVEFLRHPLKFSTMGARIPKGIILVGSPGTGKTLLAKAVAGEAGVPFYSISGSDFVEMYVGVGAARVRDLFEEAKRTSPCIVFIDEIDAVARRRGTGLGGSHDEREQTLNQLLVEMDGFAQNQGIIVMAATNRVDILDPAIMRPGRFDRKVQVGKPDVKARKQILELHSRNKRLSEDVDLERVARTTAGFTGADLENILNEAAIEATIDGRDSICKEDIDEAFIKTGIGTEKRSRVISERDKRITAYHETGHAILFHELKDVGPVHMISIIPTGEGAAGYTMPVPEKDEMHVTRGQLRHMMMAAMGGRIAEELVLSDITTGASQDIKQVTKIARAMVMQYGMSDRIGMINYDENGDDVFLGYDIAHNKTYSDKLLSEIDEEVRRIVAECYRDARAIIEAHRDVLEKCCELLMEKEKITGEEFDELFV
ncbi:MAG TPA: ATP-dependent zinc metalloprotease FtsH [Candidatus Avilachnospira avicola]|nr:ATP-dependent zinc metalloprotease FtsH [Candidatus Avilachnospira avicola]